MVNKCFVLMPFNEPFNQYYKTILIPAIKAAGLQPIRADEIYGTHAIIQDIFDGIRESAALVADVTGKNPNVNYELGIAHALNRPVVIISQSVDDIPFDYRHLRAIIYDTTKIDWPSDLSSKVTNTLLAETDRTKAETDRIRFELQKTAEIPIATSETPQSHPLAHYSKFLAVGMETIHAHLTDDNIRERLKNSNYIRVLKTWFPENDQIEEGLISAIKNGADVELLLCKPESEILTERCKSAGENRCYAWVYRGIKKAYESMTATGNKKIKIVLYDSWPGCPVIWLDKEVLMGFYFRGKSSPRWPWVSVKAGTDLAGILDEQYKGLQGLTGNVWLDSSDKIKEWLEKNKIWE